MNVKKCSNGHYYDADRSPSGCPYCLTQNPVTGMQSFYDADDIRVADIPEPPDETGKTVPAFIGFTKVSDLFDSDATILMHENEPDEEAVQSGESPAVETAEDPDVTRPDEGIPWEETSAAMTPEMVSTIISEGETPPETLSTAQDPETPSADLPGKTIPSAELSDSLKSFEPAENSSEGSDTDLGVTLPVYDNDIVSGSSRPSGKTVDPSRGAVPTNGAAPTDKAFMQSDAVQAVKQRFKKDRRSSLILLIMVSLASLMMIPAVGFNAFALLPLVLPLLLVFLFISAPRRKIKRLIKKYGVGWIDEYTKAQEMAGGAVRISENYLFGNTVISLKEIDRVYYRLQNVYGVPTAAWLIARLKGKKRQQTVCSVKRTYYDKHPVEMQDTLYFIKRTAPEIKLGYK